MKNYVDKDKLQEFATKLTAKYHTLFSSPLVASTAAEMLNTTKVYVYTGSESGYTFGNWYYYNGSAWTSGGAYNATAVNTDSTLSIQGMAADAKAVGDALNSVGVTTDTTLSVAGAPADAEAVGDALEEITDDIGDLSDLETTDKSSLVSAINEAAQSGGSGDGLTSAIKAALLQLAQKVAYIDANGQDYYDDLYNALYAVTAISLNVNSLTINTIGGTSQLTATTNPAGATVTWTSSDISVATVSSSGLVTAVAYGNATITATAGSVSATCSVVVSQVSLSSISATYTQSGTVYDNASLDDLKTDLVVTATWSDSTTTTVSSSDYTLSGTLTVGTSTVTVNYGGETDTFTVTVTAAPTVISIAATYTQSGTVYDTDSLSDLVSDLVVTATWSDSSTSTVSSSDYTLSGTLSAGTSTITVSYGGVTDTFTVTVTSASGTLLYNWDFTSSLVDTVSSRTAVLAGDNTAPTQNSNGLVFDAATQYVNLGTISSLRGKTIEIDVASLAFAGNTSYHIRFLMWPITMTSPRGTGSLIWRSSSNVGWTCYGYKPSGGALGWSDSLWASALSGSSSDVINYFGGKTVKIVFDANSNQQELYINNTLAGTITDIRTSDVPDYIAIGGMASVAQSSGDQCYDMTITGVRIYDNAA